MSNESGPDKPKIIIDSDWKSQAQAEKEKLAEAEAKTAGGTRAGGAAGGAGGAGGLPPADFHTLVGMLATQAVMYLGGVMDKRTGHAIFDPEYAYHMIGLLGVLEEKTRGNLSKDEADDLTAVLHELRARYVELAQAVAKSGGLEGGGRAAAGAASVQL